MKSYRTMLYTVPRNIFSSIVRIAIEGIDCSLRSIVLHYDMHTSYSRTDFQILPLFDSGVCDNTINKYEKRTYTNFKNKKKYKIFVVLL